jgi:hypothetical protein
MTDSMKKLLEQVAGERSRALQRAEELAGDGESILDGDGAAEFESAWWDGYDQALWFVQTTAELIAGDLEYEKSLDWEKRVTDSLRVGSDRLRSRPAKDDKDSDRE